MTASPTQGQPSQGNNSKTMNKPATPPAPYQPQAGQAPGQNPNAKPYQPEAGQTPGQNPNAKPYPPKAPGKPQHQK